MSRSSMAASITSAGRTSWISWIPMDSYQLPRPVLPARSSLRSMTKPTPRAESSTRMASTSSRPPSCPRKQGMTSTLFSSVPGMPSAASRATMIESAELSVKRSLPTASWLPGGPTPNWSEAHCSTAMPEPKGVTCISVRKRGDASAKLPGARGAMAGCAAVGYLPTASPSRLLSWYWAMRLLVVANALLAPAVGSASASASTGRSARSRPAILPARPAGLRARRRGHLTRVSLALVASVPSRPKRGSPTASQGEPSRRETCASARRLACDQPSPAPPTSSPPEASPHRATSSPDNTNSHVVRHTRRRQARADHLHQGRHRARGQVV
ncbi:hypothetical protein T492DRAFT_482046 [Pavlovales sp. CCMP2436]|nr:hypothetical protein T492DRAFT_482046 [Pavlovales sp. CCMP2436]